MMSYIFENQIGVQVLGSGSRGNAVLVYTVSGALLIDAGLSGRELTKRLDACGMDLNQLRAVLLTHEHNDHARGLKGLLNKVSVPVWANAQTADFLSARGLDGVEWKLFNTNESFAAGPFKVESFPIPHDAYDPCGYCIEFADKSVCILTDLGYCTDAVKDAAARSHVIILEANYDPELLAADTKRPWATKQRIMARHGHLSNVQASQLLAQLKGAPLKHVFLAHMSEDCNQPDVAVIEVRKGLQLGELQHVQVHLTHQDKPSESILV
jgi:phosphoribosyl 1,2-cyclic phosphodiesterase